MDVYATSKLCVETTAASFARRFPDTDIYILRIGAVITPDRFESAFAKYVGEPEKWKVHGWSYTDARDLGNMCHAGLMTDGLGYQVFNAVNDDITNDEPSEEFLSRMCPGTRLMRPMGTFEAPITNRKMKEMLGFEEEFGWRRVLEK
jgi:nucleoside-diphosphate-sugar epimerase